MRNLLIVAVLLFAVVAPVSYVAAVRAADQAIGQAVVGRIAAAFMDAAVVLWG